MIITSENEFIVNFSNAFAEKLKNLWVIRKTSKFFQCHRKINQLFCQNEYFLWKIIYVQTKIIIHIDFCDQISDKGKPYFSVVPYELVYLKIMRKIIIDIKSSFKSVWFRWYVFDYFVRLYFKLPDRGPKWLVRHLVSKLEHLIL